MRIVSLGGSNSVLKNGLTKGLKDRCEVFDLSLGASTSQQNLCALIRNRDSFSECDIFVTESNINDIHALNNTDVDFQSLSFSIRAYYRAIFELKKHAIVLLLPMSEEFKYVETVNDLHRECCSKYGFYCLDFDGYLKVYESPFPILEDRLHPLVLVMQSIGRKLADFILNGNFEFIGEPLPGFLDEFKWINASDVGNVTGCNVFEKSNSRFKELCVQVSYAFSLPDVFHSRHVLGVWTWSDGLSSFFMGTKESIIHKNVNNLNSFNELCKPILISSDLQIDSVKNGLCHGERSINVGREINVVAKVNLVGLFTSLLEPEKISVKYGLSDDCGNSSLKNLNFLIPDLELLNEYSDVKLKELKFKHDINNCIYMGEVKQVSGLITPHFVKVNSDLIVDVARDLNRQCPLFAYKYLSLVKSKTQLPAKSLQLWRGLNERLEEEDYVWVVNHLHDLRKLVADGEIETLERLISHLLGAEKSRVLSLIRDMADEMGSEEREKAIVLFKFVLGYRRESGWLKGKITKLTGEH